MSKRVCFLLLVLLAPAALARSTEPATGLTVAKFDQLLAGLHNHSDRSSARQIAGLRLTERVSSAKLTEWEGQFHGNRTRQALIAVADATAFLPPPLAEIPAIGPPDRLRQEQILGRMIDYVKKTLPKLPNFSALRSTTSFVVTTEHQLRSQEQDSQLFERREPKQYFHRALGPAQSNGLGYGQLYWLGAFNQMVSYRKGTEVRDSSAETAKQLGHMHILTTSGEFGPVLEVVLVDAQPDKILWDHWESGPKGPVAVFRYTVAEERSHYAVELSRDHHSEFPAYHGEVAVDPSSGEVIRITVRAMVRQANTLLEASILVEFGATQIGGMTYICPIRGVAMTKVFDVFNDQDAQPPPAPWQTSINDVAFTNYHVFRSNSRVITDTPVE